MTSLTGVVYFSFWLKTTNERAAKCIRVISGLLGVDTQGMGVVGVGHAGEGCDSSLQIKMLKLFCIFITSAHLGKFGLLRSSDSFWSI